MRRRLWRYWPWLPPGRQQVSAIVLGVLVVTALPLAVIKLPLFGWNANTGFGPDWDCEQLPWRAGLHQEAAQQCS
jgi:hypothetical protein